MAKRYSHDTKNKVLVQLTAGFFSLPLASHQAMSAARNLSYTRFMRALERTWRR